MIDPLLDLTAELRARLQPFQGGRNPQLLGCVEGLCLLRDGSGPHHRPAAQVVPPAGPWDLSPLIDHTLLKADATGAQVEILCAEALQHGFALVCINPMGVKASGGIRTYEDALHMVLAGATRLGLSASVAVVQGRAGSGAY